jgi:phenylacetate-CoA ligase
MSLSELDRSTAAEVRKFQEAALMEQLTYLSVRSPYYKRLFAAHSIDIDTILTLEDLQRIPVTTKDHLQQYNQDFICVDRNDIADYVTTSGTLGEPVTFALTEKDLGRLAYNEAVSLNYTGGTSTDVYQLMCTMDKRFMAGLAYYLGARRMGAGTIRVGAGEPELQWDSIKRFSPTALITVPSFLLKMLEYAEMYNIEFRATSVKKAICIGESVRNSDFSLNTLGRLIKAKWDIELYSTYASTEMSTAFTECSYGVGGHHIPELIIVELLDENDQPCKEGEAGEVTITTLGVEGMPLLRFKTGDICYQHTETCACGRTSLRLGPVQGRRQQMMKYKGTTLYPEAIFNALNDLKQVENYVVEVSSTEAGTDDITVKLGMHTTHDLAEQEFTEQLKSRLRVTPRIEILTPAEVGGILASSKSRKPLKFIDNRKK